MSPAAALILSVAGLALLYAEVFVWEPRLRRQRREASYRLQRDAERRAAENARPLGSVRLP